VDAAGEAADATNDGRPCQDGAQLVIACPMNCNGDIVFIILLEFKSDGDAVGKEYRLGLLSWSS
jgi:hypothetical protein